jgi:hypothetical protein
MYDYWLQTDPSLARHHPWFVVITPFYAAEEEKGHPWTSET